MKQKAIFKSVRLALTLLSSHLRKALNEASLTEKRRRRLTAILDVVTTLNALLQMAD